MKQIVILNEVERSEESLFSHLIPRCFFAQHDKSRVDFILLDARSMMVWKNED